MKHAISIAILIGLAVAAQPVEAADAVCLTVRNIAETQANKDGTFVIFKMRTPLFRIFPDVAVIFASGDPGKTTAMDDF